MTAAQAIEYLAKKPPEMPVFVLLASDSIAAGLVREWSFRAEQAGVNETKVAGAMTDAEDMEDWPEKRLPD